MPTDQINKALGPSPGPGCSPQKRQLQKSIDWTRFRNYGARDWRSEAGPIQPGRVTVTGRLDRVGPGVTQ